MLKNYRRQLDAQLQTQEAKQAIERVRTCHEVFGKYPTIESLIGLAQAGNQNYEDKDAVLAILLSEIKRDATVFPLLNIMFWDSLARMYHDKRRRVPDADELFHRIQVEFFQVAVDYPLERRPRKIDVNLVLDTNKKVTRWQREEIVRQGRHRRLIEADEGRPPLGEIQVPEVSPEDMETYLLDKVYRRIITERQYDFLLETRVYKRMTQKAWADAHGIADSTARCWELRTEAAIRRYEEARRKPAPEAE